MKIKSIAIGICLGVITTFLPATVLVLSMFLISLQLIRSYVKTESRDFLMTIFLIGFVIRVIVASLNYCAAEYAGIGADTQPDARVYNSHAIYVASLVSGNKYLHERERDIVLNREVDAAEEVHRGKLPRMMDYQFGFYVYYIGWIYALLGYAPIAVKIMNGLAGCMTAIITYFVARLLVKSEIAARMSAGIMIFLPSALYWSVTLLRDAMANLLFLLYSVLLLFYLKNKKIGFLIASIITAVLFSLLKEKIAILIIAGFIVVLLLKFARQMLVVRKVRLWTMIVPVVVILIALIVWKHDLISSFIYENLKLMIGIHRSSSWQADATTYSLYYEINQDGALDLKLPQSVFKALVFYFLAPFPWQIPYGHGLLLIFYPQMTLTFLCLPFIIIGMAASLRRNFFMILTTLLLLALIVIPQAMTEGIVGNVVRHRDMFAPFVSIFLSYGLCLTMLPSKKIHKTGADSL